MSKSLSGRTSEPPETHVEDERDKQHCHSRKLSIGGASVEIFGILVVLFCHVGEIAGFCADSWETNRMKETLILFWLVILIRISHLMACVTNTGYTYHRESVCRTSSIFATIIFWISSSSFLVLTRKSFSSLQDLLNISNHNSLDVLQLCVNTAQGPPSSAVHIWLLNFLDVGVWNNM